MLNLDNTSIEVGQNVSITAWTETMPAGSDPQLETIGRNGACNGLVDLCDQGSGSAQGSIDIREGTTLLCTIDLSNPAFGNAATGVATAQGLPLSDVGVAAGDADNYIVRDRDGNAVWSGSVG